MHHADKARLRAAAPVRFGLVEDVILALHNAHLQHTFDLLAH
jgi:hypothetical protein